MTVTWQQQQQQLCYNVHIVYNKQYGVCFYCTHHLICERGFLFEKFDVYEHQILHRILRVQHCKLQYFKVFVRSDPTRRYFQTLNAPLNEQAAALLEE